jgi:hypothetical protein
MSATINFSGLTLNEQEAQSASEVIFSKTFMSPEINQVHNVMTGVEMDKYIPLLGRLGLTGKLDPGSCGNNDINGAIATSEKMWEPKLISSRLVHCQTDLPDLLKFWKKSRIAANTWEEVDGELMTFIEDQASESVKDSILRHADFGDKGASPVGDGTGDETLTVGTDKAYFNVIDGLWAQIFADQALGASALTYRHSLASYNGQATKALQNSTLVAATDACIDAMRAMYDNIAPEAFQGTNLVFQMTRSMYNNWLAFLEDKSLIFTLSQAEQKTSNGLAYRGIPIVVRYDWDRIIRTYYDNGTTYYLPHRIILADINNIPIGTSDSESLTMLKSHFDLTTEKHYIKNAYKIDMKILVEEELASAY